MPTCASRKLLDLLGADVSGRSRRARMRARLPQVTIVGDDRRHNREASPDSVLGPADKSGESDLRPMVELVIRQIPAAAISPNGQLGLLALWKRPHRAHIGALPA
jgi:hypothetical protein